MADNGDSNGTNGTLNGTNGTENTQHVEKHVHVVEPITMETDATNNDAVDTDASDAEPDGPEISEELGKVVIKPNEVNALELDFQHCKIPKIENLEVLTKIENLGFRLVLRNKSRGLINRPPPPLPRLEIFPTFFSLKYTPLNKTKEFFSP